MIAMSASANVVVAVGCDDPGWRALAWAVAETAALDGRLVICHTVDPHGPLAVAGERPSTAVLDNANPLLARAVAGARARLGGDRVSMILPTENPVAVLTRAAATAGLVVVGAEEHPARLGLRAEARRVAAQAGCPVVVVRPVRGALGPFAGHVVVGIDGSPAARDALAFGFRYADRHRAPVVAVHVSDELPGDVWVDDRMLETHLVHPNAALTLLDEEVEPWRLAYPRVVVRRAVFAGPPVPGLLRAAAGARLLVVGDRGRGLAARTLLGSTSQGVVAHARGPVAVVHRRPRRAEGPHREVPAALGGSVATVKADAVDNAPQEDAMKTYRIVVGVDGSADGDRALRWAVGDAGRRGGTVQAVIAWTWDGIDRALVTKTHPSDERRAAEEKLARSMAEAIKDFPGVMIAGEVVEGRPFQVLVEAAKDADLLVVGSHGHGRLHHAVVGSVAEECIRSAACPVVVVPVPHAQRVPKPAQVQLAVGT
jgi:nucleotide-binding universal stress UspA family protein